MTLPEANFADVNNNVTIHPAEVIDIVPTIAAEYIESIEIDWQNKRQEWLEWKKTNNRSRSIYAHLSFIEYLRETGDRKKINKQVPINLPQVDESSSNEYLKVGPSNEDLKQGSSTEEIRTKQNGLDDFHAKQREARTTGYLEKYLKNKSQPSIGKGTCGKAPPTNVQSRAKSPTEVGAKKPASKPKKNVTPFTNSSSAQNKNVIPAGANQNKDGSGYSRCSMGSQVQSRKSQQTPGYKTSNSSGTAAKPKKSLIPTKCTARSAPVKVTSVDTTGQGKGIRGRKKVATGSTAMGSEAQSKSKISVTPGETSPHLNPPDKQEIGMELNANGISEQEPPTVLNKNVSSESCALANPGDTNDPTGDKKDSNDADAKDHTNSQKVSSIASDLAEDSYKGIAQKAREYVVQMELEWKSKRRTWLEQNKDETSHPLYICIDGCETFSEYVQKSIELRNTVPLQIPFDLLDLEIETVPEPENLSCEAEVGKNSPNDIEVQMVPMQNNLGLQKKYETQDLNGVETSFTSETLPSPLRYQRMVTVKKYNYEETWSSQEESSYEVYVERSNHVLKEMQEAIDSENSRKLDTSMREFIKTFQDYEESTSQNDIQARQTDN